MKHKIISFIRSYLTPHRSKLLIILCLLFFSSFISLIIPQFYKIIIDVYIPNKKIIYILALLSFTALMLFSQKYIDYLETRLSSKLKRDIFVKLKMDVYDRIQKLPLNYYLNNSSGNIISKFVFDADNAQVFFGNTALVIIRDLIFILILFPFMLLLDVEITLTTIILIPLSFFIFKIYSKKLLVSGQKLSENYEEYTSNLQENIAQIKFIKTFNLHNLKANEMSEKIEKVENEKRKIEIKSAQYSVLSVITLIGSNFIIWGLGSYKIMIGDITIGSLIALTHYFALALQPFSRTYINMLNYSRSAPSLHRLAELLNLEEEINHKAGNSPPRNNWKSIRFENVNFSYNSNFKPKIFDNLNLEFKENSCTLIEGPSGSGKTTLFHLLLRFFTPQNGQIYLNEIPIAKYNLFDYRKLFGIVFQEPVLFNTSIINNITLFKQDIDPEKFKEVVHMTGLDSVSGQLADGLENKVGEGGVKLSGGQKQKICLARALLLDSPFIIFDEATANLDRNSEFEIISALKNIVGTKTIIIISHRFPKHLLQPDQIVKLVAPAQKGQSTPGG